LSEKKVDWAQVATDYITGTMSYKALAEKYGVSPKSIERHSKDGGWRDKRRKHGEKMSARLTSSEERKQVKRRARYRAIEDKLLTKLERAVDELDLVLQTKVKKTKTIEYNNEKRPEKPTKEVVEEVQEIEAVHVMIDRTGLAAVTNALEKLKDAQGIRSPLDEDEQRARIDALRARVNADRDNEHEITVEFIGGEMGDFAK
jgi:transposase-like protein